MADKIEYSRLLLKRTNIAGVVPTIPPVSATTLNQFTPTDIFVGEMFANVEDDRFWIRTNTGIVELNTSGSTGTTVVPDLVQVLNEGNNTGGFDISVSEGNTIIYQGLSTGSTSQYLGLDVDGRTIITAASGGSGTSGTNGTNGTSGTNGASGTSGTNGTSGANGTSGTNGSSGANGTSGSSGSSGSSGTSGVGSSGSSGTSGLSGVNGTNGSSGTSGVGSSGSSGTSGTSPNQDLETTLGIGNTTGANNILFDTGYYIANDNLFGNTNQIIPEGSDGKIHITSSAGSDVSDINVNIDGINLTTENANVFVGSNPLLSSGVVIDIFSGNSLVLNGITSGASTTFLTIDPDTKAIFYTTGSTGGGSGTSGTSGTSGANGTSGSNGAAGSSGTSGTSGGGGGSVTSGTHFGLALAKGNTYDLSLTSGYIEANWTDAYTSRIIAFPFNPAQNVSMSAATLDFYRTNGVSGRQVKMVVYDNNPDALLPLNKLWESPAFTLTDFVFIQYNVNYTFSAGTTYWLGLAFNDQTQNGLTSTGYLLNGMLTIGMSNRADGWGLGYKYAVSDLISGLTIPSTWVKAPIQNWNGSTILEEGYYGGTISPPKWRIKIA